MKKHAIHPDTRIIIALTLFIIGLITFLTVGISQSMLKKKTYACTKEVKVCSDGSTVSRTGPACAFTPCPNNDLPIRPGITEEPLEVPQTAKTLKTSQVRSCTTDNDCRGWCQNKGEVLGGFGQCLPNNTCVCIYE